MRAFVNFKPHLRHLFFDDTRNVKTKNKKYENKTFRSLLKWLVLMNLRCKLSFHFMNK
jgi:hypothetical protein